MVGSQSTAIVAIDAVVTGESEILLELTNRNI